MSDPFVLAVDQGTTGTKAHRLAIDGSFATIARFEHRQLFPKPGWVEHDPEELVTHVEAAVASAGKPVSLGIANQGETIVAWDSQTKRAIYNAIVWQDSRTHDQTEKLKKDGAEELTVNIAGLPLDPYFSASKFAWIIEHVAEAKALRKEKRLRLGTSDAFFLDRLAGVFATDVTEASRTSLMNLETLAWDPRLCELFRVPMECLPEIRSTVGHFGETRSGIPVTASITDQQAALFGHGCHSPGRSKITFGTGAFALGVSGERPIIDKTSGLATTVAWRIGTEPCQYAFEGGIYNAASAVNWARGLGLFSDYDEINEFATATAISRRIIFVPALSGLACPHWDRRAAGMWIGMGLDTTKSDLMQALIEGVALLGAQVVEAMSRDRATKVPLSVDGGMARNPYFLRFLANALNRQLTVPGSEELTGLGTAQLAMIGIGLTTAASLPPAPPVQTIVEPDRPLTAADLAVFAEAVHRSRDWR